MAYANLKDALRGVAFTTATPFTSDGTAVNHDALEGNLEALLEAGGSLFVPCGNTGEYYSLSDAERVAVVSTHADVVGDRGAVVGGLGGSTAEALDLLDAYEQAGADAVMVMHPVHTYAHADGLVEYYRRIADATDLGVVLYKRGPSLPRRVVTELTEVENVVAVKFAHGDVKEFSQTVADSEGDVVWLNGIAERFAPAFAVEGAEGLTTGVGNFAPEASLALHEAVRAGDFERARELRELIRPYEDLREESGADNRLSAANNVPAVKYGLELAGLYGGPVREPLVGLSAADRDRAERYFEAIEDVGP